MKSLNSMWCNLEMKFLRDDQIRLYHDKKASHEEICDSEKKIKIE